MILADDTGLAVLPKPPPEIPLFSLIAGDEPEAIVA